MCELHVFQTQVRRESTIETKAFNPSGRLTACEAAGFEPRVAFEVERMLTNVSLVAASERVSVVPASMRDIHRESVVYRRILGARPALSHH